MAKKSFSKKSRTMRRKSGKKMGGKRQNKSSKTHHKKGKKMMWGGAPVSSVPVVESADGKTLTIEWGTYPDEGPTLSSPVYGTQSLDLPQRRLEAGSDYNSIIQNVPENSEWMLNYGGKTYNLKMLRYEAPNSGRVNGQFVFEILQNSTAIENEMGKLTI
jgi:hypothetical protein